MPSSNTAAANADSPEPRQPAARINLTKAAIDALASPPAGKRAYYTDTKIAGLQIVVTDRGVKSWYLYRRTGPNNRPKRHFLGRYPNLTTDLARRKAEQWRGDIASGNDPTAERRAARVRGVTLEDAFVEFKKVRSERLKPSTLADYSRFLETVFADWRSRPAVAITRDDVSARHQKITKENGPAHADLALRFLSALLNFASFRFESATGEPLIPHNPVKRLSQTGAWNRSKRRTTYIKPHELKPWFAGLEKLRESGPESQDALVADYLELLVLTGLRRREGARLRWTDIDLKGRTLIVRDTKNHEDHTLPLSDRLLDLFKRRFTFADGLPKPTGYVFPGPGATGYLADPRKQANKVIAESGVDFTLHDLRRTFTTVADSLDLSSYAIKRLINHKMHADVTAGYVIADVERLRKPMQQITDFMLSAAGLRAANKVISLPRESSP
jgi:integrase